MADIPIHRPRAYDPELAEEAVKERELHQKKLRDLGFLDDDFSRKYDEDDDDDDEDDDDEDDMVSTRIQELEENHKREIAKLQREIRNLKESKEDEIRALKTLSRRQTAVLKQNLYKKWESQRNAISELVVIVKSYEDQLKEISEDFIPIEVPEASQPTHPAASFPIGSDDDSKIEVEYEAIHRRLAELESENRSLRQRFEDKDESKSIQPVQMTSESKEELTKYKKLALKYKKAYEQLKERRHSHTVANAVSQIQNESQENSANREIVSAEVEQVKQRLTKIFEEHVEEMEAQHESEKQTLRDETAKIARELKKYAIVLKKLKSEKQELLEQIGSSKISDVLGGLLHLRRTAFDQSQICEMLKSDTKMLFEMMIQELDNLKKQMIHRIRRSGHETTLIMQRYTQEMKERKRLFNLVQELRGNIRVYCRVRPISQREVDMGCQIAIRFPGENEISLVNTRGREKCWEFDCVFDPNKNQEDIFREVQGLVISVMDGYNVCIFAYGQTGSGKTYTMQGPPEDPGLYYRALEELFRVSRDKQPDISYEINVSILEVYNNKIRDLLSAQPGDTKLEIRSGADGMNVPGLTKVPVENHHEVLQILDMASNIRSTGVTNMNEHSSRSHCMLSVYIRGTNHVSGEVYSGKLHLIDLAGSERLSKSGATGESRVQTQEINKSLSALGNVIAARASKQGHVPYRNSTLTYLLQDSLSGDSKTLMFVQISPVDYNVDETLQSLEFAARTRSVELGKAIKHAEKK